MPRQGDGGRKGEREKEKRRQGDKETRRQGDKETRRQGDKETRRQGDKETRRQGDKETRRQGEDTPRACRRRRLLAFGLLVSLSPCLSAAIQPFPAAVLVNLTQAVAQVGDQSVGFFGQFQQLVDGVLQRDK